MDIQMKQCEDLMRERSSSFYEAFRGLPSPRREAVFTIYAFCRMIDDSVDEPEHSLYTLDQLGDHLMELEKADGHFIWPALRGLFASFPRLTKEPFLRQMEGQHSDLTFTHYITMNQLERYCYLVAGTVGEMLLPVLREVDDESNEAVQESGIALGKAMQIVNIIRDVGEDLARGRRYIPLELMVRHGYTEEELLRGEVNGKWIALVQDLEQLAAGWLQAGMKRLDAYPPESAFAVELSAVLYGAILTAVKDNGFDVFRKRAFVEDRMKFQIYRRVKLRHFGGSEVDHEFVPKKLSGQQQMADTVGWL
ncbi:phytoene/squalene synthase family protein [Paenibacillus sp. YPG26]|uniref:phytoene/squalene synthase family protein n=1 Tax=Paenibacillus sp. YPG26 TaxID=2878915 RepID=UPI0020410EF5|nr:phytoene/squalene synthase family protein [Paenibacillus sp. YPG26]USB32906.1 squalene/phytoene synthase family protein [Paenibacillus sp. YPG26]